MKEIKYLSALNDPEENYRMLRKLPRNLAERWTREVDRWLSMEEQDCNGANARFRRSAAYPPFSVFCDFLKKEARIACNPVTIIRTKEEGEKKEEWQGKFKFGVRNKNTSRSPHAGTFASGSEEMKGAHNDKKDGRNRHRNAVHFAKTATIWTSARGSTRCPKQKGEIL